MSAGIENPFGLNVIQNRADKALSVLENKDFSIVTCFGDQELIDLHHHIRYLCFCEENKWITDPVVQARKSEYDEFDQNCKVFRYLIKYKERYIGAFRLIEPNENVHSLPGVVFSGQKDVLNAVNPEFKAPQLKKEFNYSEYVAAYKRAYKERSVLELSRVCVSKELKQAAGVPEGASMLKLVLLQAFGVARSFNKDIMTLMNEKLKNELDTLGFMPECSGVFVNHYGQKTPYYFDSKKCIEFIKNNHSDMLEGIDHIHYQRFIKGYSVEESPACLYDIAEIFEDIDEYLITILELNPIVAARVKALCERIMLRGYNAKLKQPKP